MQTNFTAEQLKDPDVARSNEVLRACVHCGMCTATCPTFQILGDELDSPRGRIYLMKQMLEEGRPADADTVKHIDRCLSCLSCMTTCPSGVHYMHLVDHARSHIAQTYKRPLGDRLLRLMLKLTVPYPRMFRLSLLGARVAKPFSAVLPKRMAGMIRMAPPRLPKPSAMDAPQVFPAQGKRRMRVAILTGCAQRVLSPSINESTIRLLNRCGAEVVVAKGIGCCGALTHHMGETKSSHAFAAANIRAWTREINGEGLDAIVINASGCGTTVKDYGHMFRTDPEMADAAATVSGLTLDVSQVLQRLSLPDDLSHAEPLRVAYHAACSLQHGQKVTAAPKQLLKQAGFEVVEPADSHLCCGSAGVYNILQPDIATELRDRKLANILEKTPEVIATGNIGCLTQLSQGTDLSIVHTVELLDWASGGPKPAGLQTAE